MNKLLYEIISKVQDALELYKQDEELVSVLKTKLDDVTKSHYNDIDVISGLRDKLTKIEEKNDALVKQAENASHERVVVDAKLMDALKRITELETENNRMIEENKAFLKVSQIVAYEKENAKLRKEIEQLKNQGKPESHNKQDEEPESHSKQEEEPELNVYEKKIKGVTYYVSDDEMMRIYSQTDDGDIGEEVGKYQVDENTGKKKPVFFTTTPLSLDS